MMSRAWRAHGHGDERRAHLRLRRARPLAVTIALAAALALAISAAPALAASFTAKISLPTHTPTVGDEKITVTATRGSQKLSGSVRYQFLFEGQLVSKQPGGTFKNGVYHDKLIWPAEAVGHKITLQVVVKTKYGTDDLDWWIQVQS